MQPSPLVRQGWRRGLGRGWGVGEIAHVPKPGVPIGVLHLAGKAPPSLPPPGRRPLTCSSAPPTQLSHSVKSRAARPRASIAPRPQEAASSSRTATPLPVAAGEGADHGDVGRGRQLRKQGPAPTRPASAPGQLCHELDRRATGRPVIAAPARAARPPRPVPSSPIFRYTDALASRTPPFLLGAYGSSHPLASRTFSLSVVHRRGRASSCSHAMPDSLEIAASSSPPEAGPPLADVDSALLCWKYSSSAGFGTCRP